MTMRALSAMVFVAAAVLSSYSSGSQPPARGEGVNPTTCVDPEYRQFDFWIGDWDVFEIDGTTPVARVHVDRTLDGCVLREDYEDTKALRGESLTIYDRVRRVWHQTWMTNKGQLLWIEGQMRDGAMVLNGSYRATNGEETLVRGTWRASGRDVRETSVTSSSDTIASMSASQRYGSGQTDSVRCESVTSSRQGFG